MSEIRTRATVYGTLDWRVRRNNESPQAGPRNGVWVLNVRPHVAILVKRMFPRIATGRTGDIELVDTPQIASELAWFMLRFPLEMNTATRCRLDVRTREHDDYVTTIDDILTGCVELNEFTPPSRAARPYQQQAADLAFATGGLLLGDDVGLGKTQSALMLLRDPTTLPALVVVPTHLPKQWFDELGAVYPNLTGHVITKGSPIVRRQRKGNYVEVPYDTGGADVVIINYAKLAGWRDHLAGKIKTVIFDEIQELRHSGTEKYRAAAAIADGADRRMGLSATPIHNYGGELYNVYEILQPGVLGSRYEFYREWGAHTTPTGGS